MENLFTNLAQVPMAQVTCEFQRLQEEHMQEVALWAAQTNTLYAQLASADEEMERLRTEVSELVSRLHDLTTEINLKEAVFNKRGHELTKMAERKEHYKTNLHRLLQVQSARHREQCNKFQDVNNKQRALLHKFQVSQKTHEECNKRLGEMNEDLRSRIADLEHELSHAAPSFVEEENKALKAENAALKARITELSSASVVGASSATKTPQGRAIADERMTVDKVSCNLFVTSEGTPEMCYRVTFKEQSLPLEDMLLFDDKNMLMMQFSKCFKDVGLGAEDENTVPLTDLIGREYHLTRDELVTYIRYLCNQFDMPPGNIISSFDEALGYECAEDNDFDPALTLLELHGNPREEEKQQQDEASEDHVDGFVFQSAAVSLDVDSLSRQAQHSVPRKARNLSNAAKRAMATKGYVGAAGKYRTHTNKDKGKGRTKSLHYDDEEYFPDV